MNEAEERRRELLRQTRKLYHEDEFIPAVHPRYGRIYNDLYGDEESERPKNSFYLRLLIGVVIFGCYIWMDFGKVQIASVSSEKIAQQIEKPMELDEVKETLAEVWKNL